MIGLKPGMGQACSCVVAQACRNGVCKCHCEVTGQCPIHHSDGQALLDTLVKATGPMPNSNLGILDGGDQLDHANRECTKAPSHKIFLPMPAPSQDTLDAHEQCKIDMVLMESLQPVSLMSHKPFSHCA